MLGAILGDIAGSRYELHEDIYDPDNPLILPVKNHITDDSLMTLAVARALVATRNDRSGFRNVLVKAMVDIAEKNRNVLWGRTFYDWLFVKKEHLPTNSYGNGAAMRISPVGWAFDDLEETKRMSREVTVVSHDHPEAIKGAEAVAVAVFLARTGHTKENIRQEMLRYYPEIEGMTLFGLQTSNYGNMDSNSWITCQGSVPQSIVAFLESESLEDAIRKAISLAADTDTQASMAGAIAEAYYGITHEQEDIVLDHLPDDPDNNLRGVCYAFGTVRKNRIS